MAIPNLSPIIIPHVVCCGCSAPMRPLIQSRANGEFTSLSLYCDNCKYGVAVSPEHVMASPDKYLSLEERLSVSRATNEAHKAWLAARAPKPVEV